MQKPTKTTSKRTATIERRTKETAITATVDLDGSGAYASRPVSAFSTT